MQYDTGWRQTISTAAAGRGRMTEIFKSLDFSLFLLLKYLCM